MVNLTQDIHPLTDFKRHTAQFVKRIKRSKRPVILTVNGRAEIIVQDAKSYQDYFTFVRTDFEPKPIYEELQRYGQGEEMQGLLR